MRLPLELVEALVQHLSDDAASLKTCALLSSTFLATSQRRLFEILVISPPSTKTSNGKAEECRSPTTKLCDLLLCSPHLSMYIQHLRLEDVGKVTTDLNGHSTHWLAEDTSFAQLLPLLHAVESLVWNSGVCGLNWYTLPPSTLQALQTALARWPLERFEVQAMFNLPLPVIKTIKGLRHLSLSMVHFMEKELPQNAIPQLGSEEGEAGDDGPLRLKSLSIVDPSRHLLSTLSNWIMENVKLVGLEELNWNTYGSYFPKGQDMVEVLRILEPAAESIRTLNVSPSLDGTSTSTVPSLSLPSLDYPNLQNLTLGFELSSFNLSSALWFRTSLENIASSDSIAHLEKINVRCQIAQGNPAASFDPSVWEMHGTLVHPLTGEMKAQRLEEVNVQLHTVYSGVQDEMVEIRKRILDGLEPLSRRISVSVAEVMGQT